MNKEYKVECPKCKKSGIVKLNLMFENANLKNIFCGICNTKVREINKAKKRVYSIGSKHPFDKVIVFWTKKDWKERKDNV